MNAALDHRLQPLADVPNIIPRYTARVGALTDDLRAAVVSSIEASVQKIQLGDAVV